MFLFAFQPIDLHRPLAQETISGQFHQFIQGQNLVHLGLSKVLCLLIDQRKGNAFMCLSSDEFEAEHPASMFSIRRTVPVILHLSLQQFITIVTFQVSGNYVYF